MTSPPPDDPNPVAPFPLRHIDGTLVEFPIAAHPAARRWVATLYPDHSNPYGWGRELWHHDRGRGFTPTHRRLAAGDIIEFGGDYPLNRRGKKLQPVRWYGFVAAIDDTWLTAIGPYPGPRTAAAASGFALTDWRKRQIAATGADTLKDTIHHHLHPAQWPAPDPATQLPDHLDQLAAAWRQQRDRRVVAAGTLGPLDTHLDSARQRLEELDERLQGARTHLEQLAGRPTPNQRAVDAARTDLDTLEQRRRHLAHNVALLEQQRHDAAPAGVDPHRFDQLDQILDSTVAHAIDNDRRQPPGYIVDLLGRRPTTRDQATTWDQRVALIETYRHRELGLDPTTEAAPVDASPIERALGPRPSQPAQTRAWEAVRQALPGPHLVSAPPGPQPELDL